MESSGEREKDPWMNSCSAGGESSIVVAGAKPSDNAATATKCRCRRNEGSIYIFSSEAQKPSVFSEEPYTGDHF